MLPPVRQGGKPALLRVLLVAGSCQHVFEHGAAPVTLRAA